MLKDKRTDWHFEEFGFVKIDAITKEILSYYDEWVADTSRQNIFETHQHTFTIGLMALEYSHSFGSEGNCIIKRKLKSADAQNEFSEIVKKVESLADGKLIRAEFVSLNPKSRIRAHKDRSDVLYVSRRFHIPIKTNDLVIFTSDKESRILKTGILYELNNTKYHSVKNNSNENRIHLIVDVLPKEYLEGIRFRDETE